MRTKFLRRRARRDGDVTATGSLVVGLKYKVYSDPPAQAVNTTTSIPPSSPVSEKPLEPVNYSSTTPDIVDSAINNNHHHNLPLRRRSNDSFGSFRTEDDSLEMHRENGRRTSYGGRQSPEGKDNSMAIIPREGKGDQYSADSNNNNGKINVQVTVLFGTLADLKKHRAQSRFTQGAITNGTGNGQLTPSEVIANGGGSIVTTTEVDGNGNGKIPIELSLISPEEHFQSNELAAKTTTEGNASVTAAVANGGSGSLSNGSAKFSGIITGDVVSDSTRSKRCCVVM